MQNTFESIAGEMSTIGYWSGDLEAMWEPLQRLLPGFTVRVPSIQSLSRLEDAYRAHDQTAFERLTREALQEWCEEFFRVWV